MKNAIMQVTYFLIGSVFNMLYYCHVIAYWEKMTLYKKFSNNQRSNAIDGSVKKFQLKLELFKNFLSPKQRSACRKLFSPPRDESFLHLWNKNFRTEIYRIFAFQVLWECSSWKSRNDAVEMIFLTPTKKIFLAMLREYVFYNFEWVEVR